MSTLLIAATSSLRSQSPRPCVEGISELFQQYRPKGDELTPHAQCTCGFVEGLNNKIRVIQRRAYGLRDEDYLRLKILTCMLPAL
jgi:hypothetical protein